MLEKETTTIFVIRHGKPKYTLDALGRRLIYGPEVNLSPEGENQAREMAERIQSLDSVVSSPYPRARQTAQIIGDKHQLPELTIVEDIKDIIAQGAVGLPLDDLVSGKITPKRDPNDETLDELERRVIPAFQEIFVRQTGKSTAIVSHGDAIRVMAYRLVEKQSGPLPPAMKLQEYNYINPGEAWKLGLNNQGIIVSSQMLSRPETKMPGKRAG